MAKRCSRGSSRYNQGEKLHGPDLLRRRVVYDPLNEVRQIAERASKGSLKHGARLVVSDCKGHRAIRNTVADSRYSI